MKFVITTSRGLEEVLEAELLEIDPSLKIESRSMGLISVDAREDFYYQVCLHSRVALRVLLPLFEFDCPDEKKLYGAIRSFRWMDHFEPDAKLAISFHTKDSAVHHSKYGAQKVKDAIVDQMKSFYSERPSVDLEQPDFHVHVYLKQDYAQVSLDLSGASLHERGYRPFGGMAPLKEHLAAGLVRWIMLKTGKKPDYFCDFMSGSGTLVLEAAQIALKISPAIHRRHYGFLKWKKSKRAHWEELVKEVTETSRVKLSTDSQIRFRGFDQDARILESARRAARTLGLQNWVEFQKFQLRPNQEPPIWNWLEDPQLAATEHKFVMVNPPYGERLGEVEELKPLYSGIGDLFKKKFKGFQAGVFTTSSELSKEIGLKADVRIPVWNGPLDGRLFLYSLY